MVDDPQSHAMREALADIDVIRHDAMVEEKLSSDEALERIRVVLDAYLDEWEGGHW